MIKIKASSVLLILYHNSYIINYFCVQILLVNYSAFCATLYIKNSDISTTYIVTNIIIIISINKTHVYGNNKEMFSVDVHAYYAE